MTDGQGKTVNFKNTIIVMTSNMGQQNILSTLCGRQASDEEIERCTYNVMQQLRQRVAPEFINRIDNIVMFMPLSIDDVAKIAEMNLKKEQKKLQDKDVSIIIEPPVVRFIVEHGYQPEYGARHVKRAITDYIINPLTTEMVNGTVDRNRPICISASNNKIILKNGSTSKV